MAKATVYRFKGWDISKDDYVFSRRWATANCVKGLGCLIIESTEKEIDESEFESGNEWTPIDEALSDSVV